MRPDATTPPAWPRRRLTLAERLARYQAELDGQPVTARAWSASTTPTLAELEALIAVVEHTNAQAAADALGVSPLTVRSHMSNLYAKIGAVSRPHAVRILWPVIGDAIRLSGHRPRSDRRLGRERGAAS